MDEFAGLKPVRQPESSGMGFALFYPVMAGFWRIQFTVFLVLNIQLVHAADLSNEEWYRRAELLKQRLNYENGPSFSLDDLQSFEKKGEAFGLTNWVKYIKTNFPTIHAKQVRAIASRSLHHADPKHPRPHHSTSDGLIQYAYSTHERDPNFNSLDVIAFDLDAVIRNPDGPAYIFMEGTEKNGSLHWTESGAKCGTCHESREGDPSTRRPLVNGYPYWERYAMGVREIPYGVQNPAHVKMIEAQEKQIADHPDSRLGLLGAIENEDHNLEGFGEKVNAWNMFRLARKIRADKSYDQIEKALFVSLEVADPLSNNFGGNTRNEVAVAMAFGTPGEPLHEEYLRRFRILYEEYYNSIRHHLQSYAETNDQLFAASADDYWNKTLTQITDYKTNKPIEATKLETRARDFAQRIAILGTTLSFLGMDLRDYSLQMTRNTPYFGGISYHSLREITAILAPELPPMKTTEEQDARIDAWAKNSRAAMAQFKPRPMKPEAEWSAVRLMQSECSGCHSRSEVSGASSISFMDQAKFNADLTPELAREILERVKSGDIYHRMPAMYPGWSDKDIKALESHFDSVLTVKKLNGQDEKPCR